MMLENYQIFKALHIIFMVSWFAGLFYIVRLFIYHAEANEKTQIEKDILHQQFELMQWRLWYIITTPAMYLTVVFGVLMLMANSSLLQLPWMHVKLTLVVLLLVYHFICQSIMNNQKNKTSALTSNKLRLWNELATLFLVAIVFIVELQHTMNWIGGVVGFFGVGITLMIGIKLYKKYRKNN